VATLSGKTFEVQIRERDRWLTVDVHESRTSALNQAESLVDSGKYSAVQVLSDSDRTGTEVIFEQATDDTDRALVKLVAVRKAPACDQIEDYYRFESRQTIGKILRQRLDQVGKSALEFLFDRTEMNLLERDEILFPQFMQIAAAAQARSNGDDASKRLEILYDAVAGIKQRAVEWITDDSAKTAIKTRGIDALISLADRRYKADEVHTYICYGFACFLNDAGDWNSKIRLLVGLADGNVSSAGLVYLDEVLAEILDGAAAVGELLGGQSDAFAANRTLISLCEGRYRGPASAISCIGEFNDMMGKYNLPLTREVMFQRVAGYLSSTRNLTREGPKAEREAFTGLVQVLTEIAGLKGGVPVAGAVVRRARIALSDGDDLSFEEAMAKVVGLISSRAARVGFIIELLQSDIGAQNKNAVLMILSNTLRQIKSLTSLVPDRSSESDTQSAISGLKDRLSSELLPEDWRKSLTKTFDDLLSAPKPTGLKTKKYAPPTEEYKQMIKKAPERKIIDENQVLFKEGDSGSEAYLILSGEVEIYRMIGNQEEVIATVGRGDIIGEMSLIDNQPRMASARVLAGGEVSIIDQENFSLRLDNLEVNDRVLRRLIDVLVNRMRGEGRTFP